MSNTSTTAVPPRLGADQVARYRQEGYLTFNQPVLPAERFAGLKAKFEQMLADLPPDERPESMDVPHFMNPELLDWAFDPNILALVEPIVGPDIALFSTHFICKPKGNGKRVPWHEDSAYWKGMIDPMEVATVWLAIDPSTKANGCMKVIPRSHEGPNKGFSDYDQVDTATSVFATEIVKEQRDDGSQVYIELQPNECSLHDARIMHGSEPNTSSIRRCGWTLRFASTACKFNEAQFAGAHQVYLAKGRDRGGNRFADPTRQYPELIAARTASTRYKNSH
jgi:ectoine hydroxylase-related dioxygenase (phytanoyl-CoA dioxygenase family)